MNNHQYISFTCIARQILDYAVELEIIDSNPFDRIRIQKKRILKPEIKGPTITQVFMEDERQLLIKYAMEQYDKRRDYVQKFTSLAIAFLLYVPLRRGELVALRFDVLDGNRLVLIDSYSHGTKSLTGRLKDIEGWRTVDVVPPALEIIEKIRQERIRLGLPTDGCIFTVNEKYGSLYSALGKTINNYCDELGIPRRSLHKTRKTCASKMHADGVNDLIIQAQLGHKDLRTTYNSYCYDVTTDAERYRAISASLA
jgi:integrase